MKFYAIKHKHLGWFKKKNYYDEHFSHTFEYARIYNQSKTAKSVLNYVKQYINSEVVIIELSITEKELE